MKRLIIFLIIVDCVPVLAQNLIQNPGFEEFQTCPNKFTVKFRKTIIPGWDSASAGTPDYFNSCSEGSAGVPANWAGDCLPVSGQGYMGIYLYRPDGFREYLQTRFLRELVKGEIYTISFHISHALNASYHIDQIGVLISQEAVFAYNPVLYQEDFENKNVNKKLNQPIQAQRPKYIVNKDKGYYLSQKLNTYSTSMKDWELVELQYEAHGGELYITIGNFEPQQMTRLVKAEQRMQNEPMLSNSAYVLMDNVTFTPINEPKKTKPDSVVEKVVLSDLNFEFDNHKLTTLGCMMIDSALHLIDSKSETFSIRIIGHTDNLGSRDYNTKLGYKRANEVKNYMITKGFRHSIVVESFGENKPVSSNESELGRSKNRRVEVLFIPVNSEGK